MASAGADDRGTVHGGRSRFGLPRRLGGSHLSGMDCRADADLWLLLRRADAVDGAILLGRQVGPAAAPAVGGDEPDDAAGVSLLGGPGIHAEEAVRVGQSRA